MRFFLFIIGMLLFFSCQKVQKEKKPKDLIPQEKMVDVLTELALVHSAKNYSKRILEQAGIQPKNYIWEKFDIDSIQFKKSSDYYSENIPQYTAILDSVKSRLSKLEIIYKELRKEQERINDSIQELQKESLETRTPLVLLDSITEEEKNDLDTLLPVPISKDSILDPA